MADLHVVILAAGKGTRMKSRRPKVLHEAAGRPLIDWVITAARALAPVSVTAVVGHDAERVEGHLADRAVTTVRQEPQLGTGHALLQTESVLSGCTGTVLLLSGDVPLLAAATLRALVEAHASAGAAATVATAVLPDPTGYGRIIREGGEIVRIVEERDASPDERAVHEINSGIYAFDLAPLFPALRAVGTANAQGEYYLPDLVGILRGAGRTVGTYAIADPDEMRGVNSRADLAEVAAIARRRTLTALMASGVTIVDPASTYVDADVTVGMDTVLHPGVTLQGRTSIGEECEILPWSRLSDATVGDRVRVLDHSLVDDAAIDHDAVVGPFARLRPRSHVGPSAHVGNFVELKNTTLGEGSKANHLAYLGDATIGSGVNVGAGTITCNYDGAAKHRTTIHDGAFIGSDSTLVAPVEIGAGAYVAAGSSITADVPAGALGVARSRQSNKDGWATRRKAALGAARR